MARPKSKTAPQGNLTIKELRKWYDERIEDLETEIEKIQLKHNSSLKENEDLKSKLKEMQTKVIVMVTKEEEIKQILQYYAKNFSFLEIFDKMKFLGFKDITVEKIKHICTVREDLSPEMFNYFKKQQESYIENIKINPDTYKDKLMMRYERMYGDCEVDLVNKDLTFEEKNKLKNQMSDILSKMNNVLKNIVDDGKENKTVLEINSSMDSIDKLNEAVTFTVLEEEIIN